MSKNQNPLPGTPPVPEIDRDQLRPITDFRGDRWMFCNKKPPEFDSAALALEGSLAFKQSMSRYVEELFGDKLADWMNPNTCLEGTASTAKMPGSEIRERMNEALEGKTVTIAGTVFEINLPVIDDHYCCYGGGGWVREHRWGLELVDRAGKVPPRQLTYAGAVADYRARNKVPKELEPVLDQLERMQIHVALQSWIAVDVDTPDDRKKKAKGKKAPQGKAATEGRGN